MHGDSYQQNDYREPIYAVDHYYSDNCLINRAFYFGSLLLVNGSCAIHLAITWSVVLHLIKVVSDDYMDLKVDDADSYEAGYIIHNEP